MIPSYNFIHVGEIVLNGNNTNENIYPMYKLQSKGYKKRIIFESISRTDYNYELVVCQADDSKIPLSSSMIQLPGYSSLTSSSFKANKDNIINNKNPYNERINEQISGLLSSFLIKYKY